MDITNAQRARVLVHALPYIQDYSGKIVVVKYGGNAMISEHLKDSVIRDICLLQLIGVKVVLVHGGGPEITEVLGKMGKKSTFVDGVRVTDEEAVGVALMVLAGKINKTLVNLIELKGGSAIGLSGLDGHMLEAKIKKPELGYVGEITNVNVKPILDVLDKGYPGGGHRWLRRRGSGVQHQRRYRRRTHCGRTWRGESHRHDGYRRDPQGQGRSVDAPLVHQGR